MRQTSDLSRRVYREHGAYRRDGDRRKFLMYHLPEICRDAEEVKDVVKREERAKEILEETRHLQNRGYATEKPEELEKKLIETLCLRLNPPRSSHGGVDGRQACWRLCDLPHYFCDPLRRYPLM